jgi:ATP/maltotriose-dependent transcriptional regulator MalT
VSAGWDGRDPQRFWLSVLDALRGTITDSWLARPVSAAPGLDGWAITERLLKDLALDQLEGELAEIRQAGLRFSVAEARALFQAAEVELAHPALAALHVSHNIVKTHIRSLYTHLGTYHWTEAVDRARALGLPAPAAHR